MMGKDSEGRGVEVDSGGRAGQTNGDKTKEKVMKQIVEPEKMIVEYITKGVGQNKRRVGVMVGGLDSGGVIAIGFSKVNEDLEDFNTQTGLNIAIQRTMTKEKIPVPTSIRKHLERFIQRCHRYYKRNEYRHLYGSWIADSRARDIIANSRAKSGKRDPLPCEG